MAECPPSSKDLRCLDLDQRSSAKRYAYECCVVLAALGFVYFQVGLDDTTEFVCGSILAVAWLGMSCASVSSWILLIFTMSVTEDQWVRFVHAVSGGEPLWSGWNAYKYIGVGYAIFAGTYVVHGLALLPFDVSAWLHARAKPWRLQSAPPQVLRDTSKLLRTLGKNFVFIFFFCGALALHAERAQGSSGAVFGPESGVPALPSKAEQLKYILTGIAWNEVNFYYLHRLLHHPRLYASVHKMHHEYTAPFALMAIYCHPVELVLADLWPFLGFIFFWRVHLFFIYCWIAAAIVGTQTHHCGYKFPWFADSLSDQPDYHDMHHKVFTKNYGNLPIFDYLHGTMAQAPKKSNVAKKAD
jgi:methylsterol monooxygenase